MSDADYIKKLEEIAHAAWHALDDSAAVYGGDVQIMQTDYLALLSALSAIHGEDGDIHDVLNQQENDLRRLRTEWTRETPTKDGWIWWKEREDSKPEVLYVSEISGHPGKYEAAYHRMTWGRWVDDIGGLWGPTIQEALSNDDSD